VTKGESSTENPVDILWPSAVEKHNFTVGASHEGAASIEDKHGVRVSLSIKKYLRIGQRYVDG
jgi:hypothetical protein